LESGRHAAGAPGTAASSIFQYLNAPTVELASSKMPLSQSVSPLLLTIMSETHTCIECKEEKECSGFHKKQWKLQDKGTCTLVVAMTIRQKESLEFVRAAIRKRKRRISIRSNGV
jgi:hypothetical protein